MARGKTQGDMTDLARQTQALFTLNGAAAPQAERLVQAQEETLKEIERFAERWFERRHKAIETANEALSEAGASGGGDAAATLRALTRWQRGSCQRLTTDLQEWMTLCTQVAQRAVEAQSAAAAAVTDASRTTPASANGKSEHAAPV